MQPNCSSSLFWNQETSVKTGLSPERMQLRRLSRVFRKRLWSYVLTRCQRFAFQSPNVSKNGDKRNGHTFDPLGSNVSILSSNNQLLALHNGCQEVVSKGVLDRFVRLSRPSITLIFNTLEANNKNQQLSRGSKLVNAHQYVTGKTLMKSQTSAEESRTRFRPCLGVRSVLGSWGVFGLGEVVWKVKHSSVRIANPLLSLDRCRSISVSRGLFGRPGGALITSVLF